MNNKKLSTLAASLITKSISFGFDDAQEMICDYLKRCAKDLDFEGDNANKVILELVTSIKNMCKEYKERCNGL